MASDPKTMPENSENTLVSEPNAPPPTLSDSTPQQSNATLSSNKDTAAAPMPPIDPTSLPAPGATAPIPATNGTRTGTTTTTTLPPIPHPHNFCGPNANRGKMNGVNPPLTLNQLAIVSASQNKLPTSRVKGIVMRMGRHTQSSAKKLGRWYKNENYVDNANYSWQNMELFIDYQNQMYTPSGTIKASCKK